LLDLEIAFISFDIELGKDIFLVAIWNRYACVSSIKKCGTNWQKVSISKTKALCINIVKLIACQGIKVKTSLEIAIIVITKSDEASCLILKV